jgi:hypothetical protein
MFMVRGALLLITLLTVSTTGWILSHFPSEPPRAQSRTHLSGEDLERHRAARPSFWHDFMLRP